MLTLGGIYEEAMGITFKRVIAVSKNSWIHQLARKVGKEVFVADDVVEALDIAYTINPDLVVFDSRNNPDSVARFITETDNIKDIAVIVAGEKNSSDSIKEEFIRAGALCFLNEPYDVNSIIQAVGQECNKDENSECCKPANGFFAEEFAASVPIVGQSKAIKKQLKLIKLIAESRCNPILIIGETGTGKEPAAKAVHLIRSPKEPFVALNCAALTANLLESELFGHEKGSFTGADRDKTGLLEMAGAGTVFLDEISEMPLELQAKLLRVTQEKEFRKVGGVKTMQCKATIIASSNRDLKQESQAGRFRSDLYYRLNICPIIIEPLTSPDRKCDIPLLAEYFIETSELCPGKPNKVKGITKMALEALEQNSWPGNVRELKNIIERAILLETTDKIGLSSIVFDQNYYGQSNTGSVSDFSLEKAERQLIAGALQQTRWQKTQAAALLGISRATLYAKLEQYNIQKKDYGSTSSSGFVEEALPLAAV